MQCQDFEILWSDHSQPPFPYLSRQECTQPLGFQDDLEDKSTLPCAWCSCTGHWFHKFLQDGTFHLGQPNKVRHKSHLGNSALPCNPRLFYSLAGIGHPVGARASGIFLHPCNHCCSCTLALLEGNFDKQRTASEMHVEPQIFSSSLIHFIHFHWRNPSQPQSGMLSQEGGGPEFRNPAIGGF